MPPTASRPSRGGARLTAVRLTCDHTAELAEERKRAHAAGGALRRVGGSWRLVAYIDSAMASKFESPIVSRAAAAALATTADAIVQARALPDALAWAAVPEPAATAAGPAPTAAMPAAVVAATTGMAAGVFGGGSGGGGAAGGGGKGKPMLLCVTRALGDMPFKTPPHAAVSCVPHVHVRTLDGADRFAVLASDGLWDVVADHEAVQLAAEAMQQQRRRQLEHGGARRGSEAQAAADALLARARQLHSADNTTVMVVPIGEPL